MGILKQIQPHFAPDTDLVLLYQQNHRQEVLADLFLRYHSLVYGTCLKYLTSQETAKDATMNIYHELVEKLKTNRVENFKSWLYVVTKNHCLMHLRKQKKSMHVAFEQEHMHSEDFSHLDNVLEKEKQLQLLEKCMEKLSDDQKRSVHLFYIESKCYNEICDITGFDWNKVRSLIQNGRRNLKICMEVNG